MKNQIINELYETPYITSYELQKLITNSATGIKRYLDELVDEGYIRYCQKVQENRLINYYYLPEFSDIEIKKFIIPKEFINFLNWKIDQKIYLHMITAKSFHLSNKKETNFFTFASLEFKLLFNKKLDEYFIILPENILYFYQINESKSEYFSVTDDKTILTYDVPKEEFTLIPNPPKRFNKISSKNKLEDWRKFLIQYYAKEIEEKTPTHITSSCIALLDKISPEKYKIYGTGFLFSEHDHLTGDDYHFIVTAYHNVFDWKADSYNEYFIGLQGKFITEIILINGIKMEKENWFIDKENDIAILPVLFMDDLKQEMIHEFITRDDLPFKKPFRKNNQGIILGFGHGKCSTSKMFDKELLRLDGIPEKITNVLERENYPILIPGKGSKIVLKKIQGNRIYIHAIAINGFSGGPVFLLNENKYYLIGIMIEGKAEFDRNKNESVSKEEGTAIHFNEVINLINRETLKEYGIYRLTLESPQINKKKLEFVKGTDDEFILQDFTSNDRIQFKLKE